MRVKLYWKSGCTSETDVPEPLRETIRLPEALESLSLGLWDGRYRPPLSAQLRTFVLVRRAVDGEVVCEYHERQ